MVSSTVAFMGLLMIGLITTSCGSAAQYFVTSASKPSEIVKLATTALLCLGVAVSSAALILIWYAYRGTSPRYTGGALWKTFVILYGIMLIVFSSMMLSQASGELSNILAPSIITLILGMLLFLYGVYASLGKAIMEKKEEEKEEKKAEEKAEKKAEK